MATYAIGDIQGCFQALTQLLDKINFNEQNDRLWLTGDLVNRGPDSLAVLDFVVQLGDIAVTVLGNHDLHLLAVSEGIIAPKPDDKIMPVLSSPNKKRLMTWLRQRPLIHHDKESGFSMSHAGLYPHWDIKQGLELAAELSQILSGNGYRNLLQTMYGDAPVRWDQAVTDELRARFVINCFTRMRYLTTGYELNFSEKGAPGSQMAGLSPWFTMPARKNKKQKIIFGHWSTVHLGNIKDFTPYNVYPIDTGYLWGGQLTALRLEDEQLFGVTAG